MRKNGFQFPLSPHQVGVMVTYIFVVCTFQIVAWSEQHFWYLTTGGDIALTGLVVVLWVIIGIIDPSKYDMESCNSNYCQMCQKRIPRLDHHCVWLNTCIGARNISYFLALLTLLFCQTSLQIFWFVFLHTWDDAFHRCADLTCFNF